MNLRDSFIIYIFVVCAWRRYSNADHQRRRMWIYVLFLLSRSSMIVAVSAVQCRSMPYSHNSPQENEWMHNHNKQRGTQQSNSKDRATRSTNTLKKQRLNSRQALIEDKENKNYSSYYAILILIVITTTTTYRILTYCYYYYRPRIFLRNEHCIPFWC